MTSTTDRRVSGRGALGVRAWPRWLRRGPLENLATVWIGGGVVMLLQPVSLTLYGYSFLTMLIGIVMFTIVSKFPE